MTKMFEEYWGGQVRDIIKSLGEHKLKGEITLVVKHGKKSKIQIPNVK
jgi:16S rRNA C1402 (ribose-2'-O) methylase RsmI